MADREKQHYVPKFYLRNFSYCDNKKQIGVFNTISKICIYRAPLKNQCYKPYFYGKNGIIETQLGFIEGAAAILISKICNMNYLPRIGSEDHSVLLLHIITSLMRTPTMKNNISGIFSGMSSITKTNADNWGATDYEDKSIDSEKALVLALRGIKTGINYCSDLTIKLLINSTKRPFITSDNPVIKYNSFFEHKNCHGSGNGFSSLGLQIFLPISPTVMVVLYDPLIYKIGDRKQTTFYIHDEFEIDQINLLQFVNCDSIIYFNEKIDVNYLLSIHKRALRFEKANRVIVQEYPEANINYLSSLLVGSVTECRTMLRLSFFKFTSHAKNFVFDNNTILLRKGHAQRMQNSHGI